MERPVSDNNYLLSADMENLTVLNQQAVNTEHGMCISSNINQYEYKYYNPSLDNKE